MISGIHKSYNPVILSWLALSKVAGSKDRLKIVLVILGLVIYSCKTSTDTTESDTLLIEEPSHLVHQIAGPHLIGAYTHLPRLVAQGNKLHLTWVSQDSTQATLHYALRENAQWSATQTITSGNDWFVNWADFPALAVNGETLLTNVLQKSAEGTYDYDIKLNLTSGNTPVKSDFLLHNDGIPAEHGFVSMVPYDDGFYVSWLDGRNTKQEAKAHNAMTLFSAIVGLNGTITAPVMVDERVCDCCNTATAITLNGPIVVYRDRSTTEEEEIRDISIVRHIDGAWTDPLPVHSDLWKINGCPVNGPAIATRESNVAVTWFTMADDDPRVQLAFSKDNGATFAPPIRIDQGQAIGRVDTALLQDGSALVLWMESQGDDTLIQLRQVYPDGMIHSPITITKTLAERSSGFPQLEVINNTAYIASTLVQDDKRSIVLYTVDLSAIQ